MVSFPGDAPGDAERLACSRRIASNISGRAVGEEPEEAEVEVAVLGGVRAERLASCSRRMRAAMSNLSGRAVGEEFEEVEVEVAVLVRVRVAVLVLVPDKGDEGDDLGDNLGDDLGDDGDGGDCGDGGGVGDGDLSDGFSIVKSAAPF